MYEIMHDVDTIELPRIPEQRADDPVDAANATLDTHTPVRTEGVVTCRLCDQEWPCTPVRTALITLMHEGRDFAICGLNRIAGVSQGGLS